MGKQRRPRGPRSNWEPKPVPVEDSAAAPALESPIPAASPIVDRSATELADTPADPPVLAVAAEAIAVEEAPTAIATPAHRVEMVPLVPSIVVDERAVELAPPDASEPSAPRAPFAAVKRAASLSMAFAPERVDLAGIGATITGYVRGEGEAVSSHLRALGDARSPAELIRLQVGEIQRAADASLTCWSRVAHKVSRVFVSS